MWKSFIEKRHHFLFKIDWLLYFKYRALKATLYDANSHTSIISYVPEKPNK